MLKSAASKAMRAAKWAALFWGAVLTLAALFGLGSAALAANGQPFLLGRATNAATALTKLTGNVDGAAMRVQNTNTGTNDTALSLGVQEGEAPMRVNSSAKVTNLNADEVDGLSSEELRGQQGPPGPQGEQGPPGEQGKPGEPRYTRTVVVSPEDGATPQQNGAALLGALDGITGATAESPRLLHIEPGTYDLGNGLNTGSLNMKPFVDIEGSGELNTVITSGIQTNCQNTRPGTVNGASNAEMRFLTVRNTERICSAAISNVSASPRLTHVTAENTGGEQHNIAVWNYDSDPTMTDVTATVPRGVFFSVAVHNRDSSPTIRQSKLSGSTASLTQWTQGGDGPAKVALTQLVGPVQIISGSVRCFNNYDQDMAAITCP